MPTFQNCGKSERYYTQNPCCLTNSRNSKSGGCYYLIIFLLMFQINTLNKSSYSKPCSLSQQRAQTLNAAPLGPNPHPAGLPLLLSWGEGHRFLLSWAWGQVLTPGEELKAKCFNMRPVE